MTERRGPLTAGLRQRCASLPLWWELMRNLATRDIETRYKHSLLGLYWTIINPLVTAAIFSFVFGVIFHAGSAPLPYVIFLLTGLTFWNLFGNGVSSATTSITGSASLLAKLYFPREVMPTAAVFARLIDFGFSLAVLAIFILLYRVPVHWTVFWLAPLIVLQMLFTLGISFIVAALNVLYRDVQQLTGLVLMIWMWLSPVMYPVTTAPDALRPILLVNPMGALLQAERDVLFTGHLTELSALSTTMAWVGVMFVAGLLVFKRIEPLFAEVM